MTVDADELCALSPGRRGISASGPSTGAGRSARVVAEQPFARSGGL